MPLLKNKYSALHPSLPPCPLQTSKKIKTHPVSTPIVFLCYLFACFYQSSETEDKGACSPNGFASSSHVTRLLLAAVLVRGHSGYCCSPGAELHRVEREELGGAAATTPRPQARSLPAGRQAQGPTLHSGVLPTTPRDEQRRGQALNVHPAHLLLFEQSCGNAAWKPRGTTMTLPCGQHT